MKCASHHHPGGYVPQKFTHSIQRCQLSCRMRFLKRAGIEAQGLVLVIGFSQLLPGGSNGSKAWRSP